MLDFYLEILGKLIHIEAPKYVIRLFWNVGNNSEVVIALRGVSMLKHETQVCKEAHSKISHVWT